jgi:hypothetical protein
VRGYQLAAAPSSDSTLDLHASANRPTTTNR